MYSTINIIYLVIRATHYFRCWGWNSEEGSQDLCSHGAASAGEDRQADNKQTVNEQDVR